MTRIALTPLALLALLLAACGMGCRQEHERQAAPAAGAGGATGGEVAEPERAEPELPPYSGTARLEHDTSCASLASRAPTALNGMSHAQIADFRLRRTREYGFLGIFPAGYRPFAGAGRRIWERITPGVDWLGPAPYYVANPYLLIILTCANHVTPLNLFCPEVEISYTEGTFTESHRGAAAGCWFATAFDPGYADHPGQIRVVMVNAYDAGLHFAHVDLDASQNIDAAPAPENVARGLFSQPSFFHVGRYGVNNLSPEDRNGWLTILARGAATRIVVKLWRQTPPSPQAPANLSYRILVDSAS